ncbi:YbaB/EbfC family nucleoid-associated protein [Asanoa sp. WMMD1127]|uniref:YbaB/EbfC family nucleoid-associated protein n=1 Tax=Asanoa sp. WMMD1127 TaxID=3016107 RepID=UPI002417B117|nr:YbaB/EbfC family nucleoid-associated protein [Asanoa sp. WMMD1127]MDG4820931.1 YbaB/EbfC family nucleoid-associated protein [Asanoa sp. WMMD1127]
MAQRNEALRGRAEEVLGQYERIRAGMAELRDRLSAFSTTARSPDGLVIATVDARGQLVRLAFDPAAYRAHRPDQLAAVATATVRSAATSAAAAVQDLVAGYLPPGSGVADYVRSGQFDALLRRHA